MGKLVVFDVDGTILDSFGLFEDVVRVYSAEKGLPMPCLQSIRFGYGDPHNHDFKWGGTREEQVKHLHATFDIADKWSMSGETEKTPDLFDGVREMLDELSDAGHTLGIVTSKGEAPLIHLLDYHKVDHHFASCRSHGDVKRYGHKHKPHPDMLLCVMRELSFKPEDTIMIGDTTMDMGMGRNAGTHTIGVTWGTHLKSHLMDAGAHHIVETDIADLTKLIRAI